jgi:hypothetical protein
VSHTVRSIHRTERWLLTIVGRLYKVKLRPQNSLELPRVSKELSGMESLIIPLEISTRMRVNVLCILVFSLSLKFSTSLFSF